MAESENLQTLKRVTEVIGDPKTGLKLKVQQARLEVVRGPDKGQTMTIPPHGLVIGKSSSADFMLSDGTVSAVHFRIIPGDFGYRLEDLKSSNGTRVQDIRVEDAYLRSNEKIVVGQTTLRLKILGGYEEFPLSRDSFLGSMVGRSPIMRQVFDLLERAAASSSTLLLEGESGTGKELAAEAVHALSSRAKAPFVVVDCGNMQSALVGSQLFGHIKGAYTGASSDHVGAFAVAEGGTVFLDEIGELDSELQPRLLRVLENRQVQRIGENVYSPVNVRIIAATNKNLKSEMMKGRFRKDLFYRLSVLRVNLPPLRDRQEDIPLIAAAMINQLSRDVTPNDVLTAEVVSMLTNHDWPGNVRELRNVIERLLVFSDRPSDALDMVRTKKDWSKFPKPEDYKFHDARNIVIDRFERTYVMALLKESRGVIAHAAQKAGVTRPTFHRLIKKHGIIKIKAK